MRQRPVISSLPLAWCRSVIMTMLFPNAKVVFTVGYTKTNNPPHLFCQLQITALTFFVNKKICREMRSMNQKLFKSYICISTLKILDQNFIVTLSIILARHYVVVSKILLQ